MLKNEDAKEYSKSAAVRAYYSNKQFEHTHTQQTKNKAKTFADLLDCAYKGTIYVNFRKQYISVKLAKGALLRDKQFAHEIKVIAVENGYKVKQTKQGTIYNILPQ